MTLLCEMKCAGEIGKAVNRSEQSRMAAKNENDRGGSACRAGVKADRPIVLTPCLEKAIPYPDL